MLTAHYQKDLLTHSNVLKCSFTNETYFYFNISLLITQDPLLPTSINFNF